MYALLIKKLVLNNFVGNFYKIIMNFIVLMILAIFFTICQLCEFYFATFSFREGFYGSIFYLLTGFHGIHVIIGTIFLLICFFRYYLIILKFFFLYLNHKNLNFLNKPIRLAGVF